MCVCGYILILNPINTHTHNTHTHTHKHTQTQLHTHTLTYKHTHTPAPAAPAAAAATDMARVDPFAGPSPSMPNTPVPDDGFRV
jgi:hypothetical protein